MKTKKPSKNKKVRNPPAPMPEANIGETIPSGLEYFAQMRDKTHAQQLATISPKFAEALAAGNTKQIEGTAAVYYGLGIELGVPLPEWVKAASMQFWEGMGFKFLATFTGDASQMGKLIGLIDLTPRNDNPSESEKAVQSLAQHAKTEAVNSSADEHFDFAKGRKDAGKIVGKVQGISQRTKIFGIIAAAWHQVQLFESTEDLYLWLMTLKNEDAAAEYTLARGTQSREIRKICNRIGLKFKNQWTSPKLES